jgi:hypothetical protein
VDGGEGGKDGWEDEDFAGELQGYEEDLEWSATFSADGAI